MESDTCPVETELIPQTLYRRKRCRRVVASQENVVVHKPKEGEVHFKRKRKVDITDESNQKSECSSIFVEPMKWMESVQDGVVDEKLWCIGCKARFGQFNWASSTACSCGAWVNPAFQLHKTRIDECFG